MAVANSSSRKRAATKAADVSTRRRVVTAALELFASRGYAATGIRDIAETAGVSTATLYHYMSTKEDLLVDIMVRDLERSIRSGRAATMREVGPTRQLVALTRVHVATVALEPLMSLVLDQEVRGLSEPRVPGVMALRDEYERLWVRVIDAGRDTGSFTIIDGTLVRLALLEMGNGLARWFSPDGRLSVEQLADRHADLALALVEARESGARVRVADLGMPPASVDIGLVQEAFADMFG